MAFPWPHPALAATVAHVIGLASLPTDRLRLRARPLGAALVDGGIDARVSSSAMALVRLRGQLKQLAGGVSEHELDGATVAELLRELERAHPAVAGWILDERGLIRRHINVFVNGEQGGAATGVASSDNVDVLPAISGG